MSRNSFIFRLGKAFGNASITGVFKSGSALQRYFGRQLDASMAARIAEYIKDGTSSSVLSDCAQQSTQQKWRDNYQYYPRRDEFRLFDDLSKWSYEQMVRFGEALATLEPIQSDYGYVGTKKTPDWLRHVTTLWLADTRGGYWVGGRSGNADPAPEAVETLAELCRVGGCDLSATLEIVFTPLPGVYTEKNSLKRFSGVGNWLRANASEITQHASAASADVRVQLADTVGRLELHDVFLDHLLDQATGTAKGAREAANRALTGADKDALAKAVVARFAKATPTARSRLVEAAAATLGDRAKDVIASLREGEASSKVLAAMDRIAGAIATSPAPARSPWQKDGAAGFLAIDGEWVPAIDAEPLPEPRPISAGVLETVRPFIEAYNAKVRELQVKHKKDRYHWAKHQKVFPADSALQRVARLTGGTGVVSPQGWEHFGWLNSAVGNSDSLDRFLDHPEVNLRHLVRLGRVLGGYELQNLLGDYAGPMGLALQRRINDGADLRVVMAVWKEVGGKDFVSQYLSSQWYWGEHRLPDHSWPVLLAQFDRLDEAVGLIPQQSNASYSKLRALKLLKLFPKVPERYRASLMMLANESGLRVRELARDLLGDAQGIEDAIALQLDDGKQDVRGAAAQWLAQRGAASHIPAIRKRLKKERSEKARAHMITALERLGDDTSDFFDEDVMVAEAEKALKKAMPKGLEWFPFEALPALSWANGKPVNPILPRHWVVLSTRLKEPRGNALVDLWLDRLAPGDAHKLGWMILTGWMSEDTRQPTDEESNAHALSQVDQQLKWNRDAVKRWGMSDYYSTDYDTVFAQLKRQHGSVYLGTASDSKGMLALASRVEGSDAGPRIRTFLKNHGSRVSQAKALLDVLANIGSPGALQVLLQTADRLKQKSVQAHAAKLIEEVAERRGWTAGELADRTVPTGGLDETGVLSLECGLDRLYTARLNEEDKLILINPAGKEVKALPTARAEEEKATVAAAKKALSKARKEVKEVVAAQTDRFREAMCMERDWSSEDWINYVATHPILGRLATRLIWIGLGEDRNPIVSFRPLGDGSYTDHVDEDIEPSDFARIKLAHSTLLTQEVAKAWTDHLADYDIAPLFDQLGRALPEIDDKTRKAREIKDREGYMIETFRLRTVATKLGYQRGPAEDGGWFMTYHRVLREAKLVAEIEFTGSMLPEENIPAALISLSFRALRENGQFGPNVAFDKVPDVLLSETWRDYHDMADQGTGFDAEWEKKARL